MWRIRLNKWEEEICQIVGKGRQAEHEKRGGVNHEVCTVIAEENHIHGFAGEMAFAKAFKKYPNFNLKHGPGGFLTKMGKSIDVKTTRSLDGPLQVTPGKSTNPCDFYFLVAGTMPEFYMSGWACGRDVFQESNLTNPGHGICHQIIQQYLKKEFAVFKP